MVGRKERAGAADGAGPLFLAACVTMLAVVVAAGPVWGADMKLWPNGAPGAKGTEKNDTPTLKVFPPPKDAKGPAPAVLLIPGGGYKHISGYGTFWEFFQTRRAVRKAHDSVLGQTYRYRHGRTVRYRRKVPVEQRCRAEYRHLSRRALEEATWPGVTEDEYVSLRRTVATTGT